MESEPLKGSWMRKSQGSGMQRLTTELQRIPRRVQRVARDRMADIRHVNAYLMRPSGLQPEFHITKIQEPLEHLKVCHCRTA